MPLDSTDLMKARDRLKSGDVVAIPTETVYGLAASIESEAGLRKVFSLKQRPFFDPLIVHVASFKEASTVVREWPGLADYLARTFWPGPLTLVLPKAEHVNPLITSGLDTVAVRFPAHPIAQDLIRMTGTPLAAPSANKFGRTSPSRAEHVRSEFEGEDLLVIDGGECEIGVESTVLTFAGEDPAHPSEIRVLRPGGVTTEMLRTALAKWSHPVSIRVETSEASPGHLKHHYQPRIPLVITGSQATLSSENLKRVATDLKIGAPTRPEELKLSDDPAIAARELYSEMRRLSENGADLLFVRKTQDREGGLWMAIWDRLTRAASLNLTET